MLLICHDKDFAPPTGGDPETEAWVEEMDNRGVRLTGSRLRPVTDATTVRVRDGQVLFTDGPFAETAEQMLGFDLLECANLDEALEVAARHPSARRGTVEVRPLWTS